MNRSNGSKPGYRFTVAVIGGGFAGAALAAQVLRRSAGDVSVVLVERGARVGRGVAYGTECGRHLLNVRAQNMSAYPDDPEHFLGWARDKHDPSAKPSDYLPRQVYGQYIAWLLQQESERHPGRLVHVQDEAIALDRDGDRTEVRLRSGQSILAGKVVLALGNFPPGDPRLPGKTPHSQRYVCDPWANGALGDVAGAEGKDKNVLLVGSGLTSVDVVISLREQGFGGTIHILSRRGLLPQTHKAAVAWPRFWDERSPTTIRGLLRLIRTQVEAAERLGGDWRAVMDSLRPFTQEIWRSLPQREQRRFLRHVRPYWEVHRHRVAPEIGALLASEMRDNQVEIHAGRITGYGEDIDGVDVTYRERKSGALRRLRVDHVINCTGPEADCRRIENALLTNLIRQEMVRPDPLFLGLDTSQDGAVINARGEASDFLYTLGPARKGSLWETTAVPEIRVQASQTATLLLAAYERKGPTPVRSEPVADLHRVVQPIFFGREEKRPTTIPEA